MAHSVRTALIEYRDAEEFTRLAPSSQRLHRSWHRAALRVIDPSMPVASLKRNHIDTVLNTCRSRGATPATLNSVRMVLRGLCRWLVSVGYLKTDPTLHLRNEKAVTPASKRKPVATDRVKLMIATADSRHPRDAALVALLFHLGCRSAELLELTWEDVDFDRRKLTIVRTKTHDIKVCAMPVSLAERLKIWREVYAELAPAGDFDPAWFVVPPLVRRPPGANAMSSIWPIDPTRSIGTSTMRSLVKRLFIAIGERNLGGRACHTLRRSAANAIADSTGDIRAAQRLLGHKSVTQTEAYLDRSAVSQYYDGLIENWEI